MEAFDQAELDIVFAEINTLFGRKEYDQVEKLLRRVLQQAPNHPRALNALGVIACERGEHAAARELVGRALEGEPGNPSYLNSMGKICQLQGDRSEARRFFELAVASDPAPGNALCNLGILDIETGAVEAAIEHLRQAIALQPDNYTAVFYLGTVYYNIAEYDEALTLFQKAIELDPSRYNAWQGKAVTYSCQNRSVAGELLCREAVVATSNHPELQLQLALALLAQGRVSETIGWQRRVIAEHPSLSGAYSNLTFALNYDPEASQEEVYAVARGYESASCAAVTRYDSHANAKDKERQLRIGYVSADLRGHPVGYHLLPVLRNHDHSRFKVYCYSNSITGDNITMEFRELCDQWRIIHNLPDSQAAELIRSDGIDILIDLSGHTAYNRLPLFALKPAPVQATWLGYFNTTGLSAIDYLITDDATVLPGEEHLFSEKVLRLPWSRFCFAPYPALPEVAPPPSLARGYLTFGSFNTLAKINAQVVALWANVMRELPDSRLVIKRGELEDPQLQERVRALFAAEGVASERLELRTSSPYYDMLREYGDIDISLDTFPFNGGLTTLDALIMGVPVVTLSGKLPISRQSRSFLRALNLLELVSRNADRFCAIACDLARDAERLQRLRGELRGRLLNSYLCDGPEFTGNLEHAYRTMWQEWCRQGQESSGGSRG